MTYKRDTISLACQTYDPGDELKEEESMSLQKEEYIKVRQAMQQGARTIDDIKEMTDITIGDNIHIRMIQEVLNNACRCKDVSYEEAVNAVKNGATTVEKLGEATGAGTQCGRCQNLLQRIINDNQ